jgi:hypothetical protein
VFEILAYEWWLKIQIDLAKVSLGRQLIGRDSAVGGGGSGTPSLETRAIAFSEKYWELLRDLDDALGVLNYI